MKKGFTLAEVLITLGVIGVVAALTLPSLMAEYRKQIVVTRLQKFNSVIGNAVLMATNEYGPMSDWDSVANRDVDQMADWYDKYLGPNIKTLRTVKASYGEFYVYLPDGSRVLFFSIGGQNIHLYFYPIVNSKTSIMGKDYFTFFPANNTIGPYVYAWDGTREALLSTGTYACSPSNPNTHHYCTALIQYDGWKISDDYPYKF